LCVQRWGQGSDGENGGENTCAKLQHRKIVHGGSPLLEGVSTAFIY
jgi:hypothetical protein